MGFIRREDEEPEDDISEFEDDESIDEGPETPRPVLVESVSRREYEVPHYPLIIGRERKCTVCVPIPAVSRRHAKIYEQSGVFFLDDLNSVNGTFVNDRRVFEPVQLNHGDRIKIAVTKNFPRGAKEFIFRLARSEEDQLLRDVARLQSQTSLIMPEEEADEEVVETGVAKNRNTIPLKDCIFKAARKLVFLSQTPRRIPPFVVSMQQIGFYSLLPYKVGETVTISIEHPRLNPPFNIVTKVEEVSTPDDDGIREIHTVISKFSPEERQRFNTLIEVTPLIDYLGKEDKD